MNAATGANGARTRNKLAAVAKGAGAEFAKFAMAPRSAGSDVKQKGGVADLLLQVMQKAEPSRVAAMTGKLKDISAGLQGTEVASASADPAQKLEASVLTHLYGEMMPDQASGLFGTGTSGHIWQQMLTEQIAEATAGRSPLHLQDKLASSADGESNSRVRTMLHWPYFSNYEVKSYVG